MTPEMVFAEHRDRMAALEAEVAELRGQLETLGAEKEEQRRKCEEDIAAKTREIAE